MKVSPYWCAYSCKEDAKRLYDILCNLEIGDLFVYKIHYLNASDFAGKNIFHTNEYALMKKTGKRYYDVDNVLKVDNDAKLTITDIIKFYDFAEQKHHKQKTYSDEELSELKLKLTIFGKDFDTIPIFEINYDNRNTILTDDGQLMVF